MSFRFCGDMAGRKLASPLTLNVYHASHFTAGKDFFFAHDTRHGTGAHWH